MAQGSLSWRCSGWAATISVSSPHFPTHGHDAHIATDVGASQRIIDGKIKLKSSGPIKRFTKTGMLFEDGSEQAADVVLFATGYGDPRGPIRDIVGEELGKKITPVWGVDSEGEIRSAWKEIGAENLWLMMGNFAWCRFYSKRLALRMFSSSSILGDADFDSRNQGEAGGFVR